MDRPCWLRLFMSLCLVLQPTLSARSTVPAKIAPPAAPGGMISPVAVIIIPGLFNRSADLEQIHKNLIGRGISRLATLSAKTSEQYRQGMGLLLQAELLAELVPKVVARTGAPRVVLLGVGTGGLVARAYNNMITTSPWRPAVLIEVLCLNTPHRGRRWAKWAFVLGLPLPGLGPRAEALRDLAPDSEFLRSLNMPLGQDRQEQIRSAKNIVQRVVGPQRQARLMEQLGTIDQLKAKTGSRIKLALQHPETFKLEGSYQSVVSRAEEIARALRSTLSSPGQPNEQETSALARGGQIQRLNHLAEWLRRQTSLNESEIEHLAGQGRARLEKIGAIARSIDQRADRSLGELKAIYGSRQLYLADNQEVPSVRSEAEGPGFGQMCKDLGAVLDKVNKLLRTKTLEKYSTRTSDLRTHLERNEEIDPFERAFGEWREPDSGVARPELLAQLDRLVADLQTLPHLQRKMRSALELRVALQALDLTRQAWIRRGEVVLAEQGKQQLADQLRKYRSKLATLPLEGSAQAWRTQVQVLIQKFSGILKEGRLDELQNAAELAYADYQQAQRRFDTACQHQSEVWGQALVKNETQCYETTQRRLDRLALAALKSHRFQGLREVLLARTLGGAASEAEMFMHASAQRVAQAIELLDSQVQDPERLERNQTLGLQLEQERRNRSTDRPKAYQLWLERVQNWVDLVEVQWQALRGMCARARQVELQDNLVNTLASIREWVRGTEPSVAVRLRDGLEQLLRLSEGEQLQKWVQAKRGGLDHELMEASQLRRQVIIGLLDTLESEAQLVPVPDLSRLSAQAEVMVEDPATDQPELEKLWRWAEWQRVEWRRKSDQMQIDRDRIELELSRQTRSDLVIQGVHAALSTGGAMGVARTLKELGRASSSLVTAYRSGKWLEEQVRSAEDFDRALSLYQQRWDRSAGQNSLRSQRSVSQIERSRELVRLRSILETTNAKVASDQLIYDRTKQVMFDQVKGLSAEFKHELDQTRVVRSLTGEQDQGLDLRLRTWDQEQRMWQASVNRLQEKIAHQLQELRSGELAARDRLSTPMNPSLKGHGETELKALIGTKIERALHLNELAGALHDAEQQARGVKDHSDQCFAIASAQKEQILRFQLADQLAGYPAQPQAQVEAKRAQLGSTGPLQAERQTLEVMSQDQHSLSDPLEIEAKNLLSRLNGQLLMISATTLKPLGVLDQTLCQATAPGDPIDGPVLAELKGLSQGLRSYFRQVDQMALRISENGALQLTRLYMKQVSDRLTRSLAGADPFRMQAAGQLKADPQRLTQLSEKSSTQLLALIDGVRSRSLRAELRASLDQISTAGEIAKAELDQHIRGIKEQLASSDRSSALKFQPRADPASASLERSAKNLVWDVSQHAMSQELGQLEQVGRRLALGIRNQLIEVERNQVAFLVQSGLRGYQEIKGTLQQLGEQMKGKGDQGAKAGNLLQGLAEAAKDYEKAIARTAGPAWNQLISGQALLDGLEQGDGLVHSLSEVLDQQVGELGSWIDQSDLGRTLVDIAQLQRRAKDLVQNAIDQGVTSGLQGRVEQVVRAWTQTDRSLQTIFGQTPAALKQPWAALGIDEQWQGIQGHQVQLGDQLRGLWSEVKDQVQMDKLVQGLQDWPRNLGNMAKQVLAGTPKDLSILFERSGLDLVDLNNLSQGILDTVGDPLNPWGVTSSAIGLGRGVQEGLNRVGGQLTGTLGQMINSSTAQVRGAAVLNFTSLQKNILGAGGDLMKDLGQAFEFKFDASPGWLKTGKLWDTIAQVIKSDNWKFDFYQSADGWMESIGQNLEALKEKGLTWVSDRWQEVEPWVNQAKGLISDGPGDWLKSFENLKWEDLSRLLDKVLPPQYLPAKSALERLVGKGEVLGALDDLSAYLSEDMRKIYFEVKGYYQKAQTYTQLGKDAWARIQTGNWSSLLDLGSKVIGDLGTYWGREAYLRGQAEGQKASSGIDIAAFRTQAAAAVAPSAEIGFDPQTAKLRNAVLDQILFDDLRQQASQSLSGPVDRLKSQSADVLAKGRPPRWDQVMRVLKEGGKTWVDPRRLKPKAEKINRALVKTSGSYWDNVDAMHQAMRESKTFSQKLQVSAGTLTSLESGDMYDPQRVEAFDPDPDQPAVIYINGMNTPDRSADKIRASDGKVYERSAEGDRAALQERMGCRVVRIENNTHPPLGDVLQVKGHELGAIDITAKATADAIKRGITEKGEVHVIAHSQGSEIFERALELLSLEDKMHIHYQGFGPERYIDKKSYGLAETRNVRQALDPVPAVNSLRSLAILRKNVDSDWEILHKPGEKVDLLNPTKYHDFIPNYLEAVQIPRYQGLKPKKK